MSIRLGFKSASVAAAGAMLALFATSPYASATVVRLNFSGNGMHGYANLTLAPDPAASSQYQPTLNTRGSHGATPLSQWDPDGAEHIQDATGTVSYTTNQGQTTTASITGVRVLDAGSPPVFTKANPPNYNPPPVLYENLPASFSWLDPANDADSYDNLFYANGSPSVCPPNPEQAGYPNNAYPFSGGYLDIFGVMFAFSNGNSMDLWSAGATPEVNLHYGFKVFGTQASGFKVVASQGSGAMASVPAPNFVWLLGAGLLGLLVWRRAATSRRSAKVKP